MKQDYYKIFIAVLLAGMALLALPLNGMAQTVKDNISELRKIDVEEHLGRTIPLGLTFIDDNGQKVKLAKYFQPDRPVVLIMGYYTCPMLCNLVMNGVSNVLMQSPWQMGQEFQLVSVSIDPTETDLIAATKKKNYINSIGKQGFADGWAFLTGDEQASRELADAVGFQYFYVEERGEYAHPAVLTILSPEGKITRYLYGIEYRERDFRLAVTEASDGKVGSTIDRIILYCYRYDPSAGSYVPLAGKIMRLGGLITLIFLIVLLIMLRLRERRKREPAHAGIAG